MLTNLLIQACAVWLLSTTVARAAIFGPVRQWVSRGSAWLGELVSCQYCVSHYVGLIIVVSMAGPQGLRSLRGLLTGVVWWAAVVGAANMLGRVVGRADDKTKREADNV